MYRNQLWKVALIITATALSVACNASDTSDATIVDGPRKQSTADSSTLPPLSARGQHVHGLHVEEEVLLSRINVLDWGTDFAKHNVHLYEFDTRGPRRDGIPAITSPRVVPITQADEWLDEREAVIALHMNGETRAYPAQILIWHEVVNDVLGGLPVVVTYCPLCNTALAFKSTRPDGRHLDFGVVGVLRLSDLVMYDQQTESWWQQATGEAIVGELTGDRLELLPAQMLSWADFKANWPDATVLSRETGHQREYGANPYVRYDMLDDPIRFRGRADRRLHPMERVVAIELNGDPVAVPYSRLRAERVVQLEVGGGPVVVFYQLGMASPISARTVARGLEVGATGAFHADLDSQRLTFKVAGGSITDDETGSTWNIAGIATGGPFKGRALPPVIHGNHFWFAWAAFQPQTRIWTPDP